MVEVGRAKYSSSVYIDFMAEGRKLLDIANHFNESIYVEALRLLVLGTRELDVTMELDLASQCAASRMRILAFL